MARARRRRDSRTINVLNTHKMTDSEMFHCFQDSGREIDKLCNFLGLSPSAGDREKVISGVSFESMKRNKMTNYTTAEGLDHSVSPFMRKGVLHLPFSPLHVLSFDPSATAVGLIGFRVFSRKSWWLEEPFHRGTEWSVWRTLQAKDEEFKIAVSLRTLGPFLICLSRMKLFFSWTTKFIIVTTPFFIRVSSRIDCFDWCD